MILGRRSMDGKRREIVRLGHPVLRQRAEEIPRERFGTRFLRDLERDLLRTMFEDSGVGLAAPQIAVPVRAFAYYVPGEDDHDDIAPRVVFNPVLTFSGEPAAMGWEGCLSIPGLRGKVPRYASVHVSGRDADGQPLEFDAEGFHARVIQHEHDHLDGIVFLDRMTDMSSLSFEEEWDRFGTEKDLPVEV
jgi:peptide deformylase